MWTDDTIVINVNGWTFIVWCQSTITTECCDCCMTPVGGNIWTSHTAAWFFANISLRNANSLANIRFGSLAAAAPAANESVTVAHVSLKKNETVWNRSIEVAGFDQSNSDASMLTEVTLQQITLEFHQIKELLINHFQFVGLPVGCRITPFALQQHTELFHSLFVRWTFCLQCFWFC